MAANINFANFKEISRTTLHGAKWLSLKEIEYEDPKGIKRKWEVCERNFRESGYDGVDILGIVFDSTQPNKEKEIILTKQYRPPVQTQCIEFPAGLIDKDEKPQAAAERELKEETGFLGKSVSVSSPLALEPGLTSANTGLVRIDIDMKENQNPVQELEPEEFIEVLRVPVSQLWNTLATYVEKGCVVDSKVYTFALALQMSKELL